MRCTHPRTVGFKTDGKTIAWSPKDYSKEFATFLLPCGQCIECRLDYARQWAVRCMHEAQMYGDNNSFITLTYSDENLLSDQLQYSDFQLFAKRLRKKIFTDFIKKFGVQNWNLLTKEEKDVQLSRISIGYFVTGEYGDKTKRPHWHAIIFNYRPSDSTYKYTSDRGDQVFTSEELTKLWGLGNAEFGSVTFESAGYCARYAAKKLIHGMDGDHDYEPISKKSSRQAIGKKWLEKYWPDVFNYGHAILPDGQTCSVPRYYEKWFQKNYPEKWRDYVTRTKQKKFDDALERASREKERDDRALGERVLRGNYVPGITRNQAKAEITKSKFKRLQEFLKL